jgi:hypothetical protein
MKKLFLLCLVCVLSSFSYPKLWTGTYELSGGNGTYAGTGYRGEVTIQPQGDNYRVVWRIGSSQSQVGVGILDHDILSVAYCDSANNGAWGVAAFRLVSDGELEGRWASFKGTTQQPEYLIWKSY